MDDSNTGIRVVALKCPNCGGALQVPRGADRTQCDHCGSTVLIVDPQTGETRVDVSVPQTPEEAAASRRMIRIILWIIAIAVVLPIVATVLVNVIVVIVSLIVGLVASGVVH
jgi:LSD1 subclass zinc finger protein